MIRQFYDADGDSYHDRFQAWRTKHQDGVFLTLKSRTRANLHGIRCLHLGSGPPYFTSRDGYGSLTASRKICGPQRELLAWATENGVNVKPCRHCLRDNLISNGRLPLEGTRKSDHSATKRRLVNAEGELAKQDAFDPSGIEDARDRTFSSIVRRRGQPAFRKRLLVAYKGRCAITGSDVEPVLEAAHIVPYQGAKTNHPGNGLLLRADLHTLFDLGLVAVDKATMRLLVSPELEGTGYGRYRGKRISVPRELRWRPSRDALEQHRQESGLTCQVRRQTRHSDQPDGRG